MMDVLINGVRPTDPSSAIAVSDRGLHYGDGLFETMLLRQGCVPLLAEHLQRLSAGCTRLSLQCPDLEVLREEIRHVSGALAEGVVKLVVTRGAGARGYAAPAASSCTRIVAVYPPLEANRFEVTVSWCHTRLGRNPQLAGIKHLNRLEQILAQMELVAAGVEEGLMVDSAGELVSAVSSNVFLVRADVLLTPELRHCGVKGVMRAEVLRIATELGIAVHESVLRPEDVQSAQEVFLTNAVRGLRCVAALEQRRWNVGPIALQLHSELQRRLHANPG
jgi:4-amino-4-deoxychorismate lyase